MRRLPKPDRTGSRDDIVASVGPFTRKKKLFGTLPTEADIDAITELYDAYDAASGQAIASDAQSGLSEALLASIRNAFGKTHGSALRHLRDRLLDPSELCPICGIGWQEELDHFLPKAGFGAFAIYIRNLVPVCHTCNNMKRAQSGDAPTQQFVHAYFEPVPASTFLKAKIDLQGNALKVEFGVDPTAGLSEDFAARLTYQFEQLRLNARYAREVNVYAMNQSVAWWQAFDSGGPGTLGAFLQKQATMAAHAHHLNDWRPCLLRGLSEHSEFCGGGFGDAFPKLPSDTEPD